LMGENEKELMGEKEYELPSIILVGREGMLAKLFKSVGKSTVGNLLLKACENSTEPFEIFNGPYEGNGEQKFILVDTPGFTGERTSSNRLWSKINKVIDRSSNRPWNKINKVIGNSCVHGVQAFLFVLGIMSHLDECMTELNNENVIMVFTKCTNEQTDTREKMELSFADFVKEYIEKVNHRWIVAPNPEIYGDDSEATTSNMDNLKNMITEIKEPLKRSKKMNSWHIDYRIIVFAGLVLISMIIAYFNTSNKPEFSVATPAIILLGETGSGKSTLGNFLGNGSCKFIAKQSRFPVTKVCEDCSIIIKNHTYNLIDTPGLNEPNSIKLIYDKIRYKFKIMKIKAIIFIIDPLKYESLNNTLKLMKLFSGQVINNKIAVLTNLKRKLIKEFTVSDKKVIKNHREISELTVIDKKVIKNHRELSKFTVIDKKVIKNHEEISEDTKALLESIGYNLAIFPDPEYNEE
ncbi:30472_t:CDS:2, partial [Gigaspora margarita]